MDSKRRVLVLLIPLLLLLLPVAALVYVAVQKHQWAQNRLAELEPRHARLLGLESKRDELDGALARIQAARERYLYPAIQDATQAGNAAQQRVRDIFTGSGMQVISSQVLPPKTEGAVDRIPLTVRTEGDQLALQSALAVLSGQNPVVLIQELDVQMQGGAGNPYAPPRLAAQFSLIVLRDRP